MKNQYESNLKPAPNFMKSATKRTFLGNFKPSIVLFITPTFRSF